MVLARSSDSGTETMLQHQTIQGTPVAPGLAVGPVHVIHAGPSDVPTWTVGREDVPLEIGRLASALNVAAERLEKRQRLVAKGASEKDAEIFAVHRMILQDPGAMRDVEEAIAQQRINAEAAVKLLIDRFESTLGHLDGNSVRGFASDVSDPWRFVLDVLLERDREEMIQARHPVILAAAELTPSVVSFLERSQILGVVAESGGRFSHGAVLTRSLGVPCVVGLPNLLARLEQGMTLTVDGDRGLVQLRPPQDLIDEFLERKLKLEAHRDVLRAECAEPAETRDGVRFGVKVNIESVRDVETFETSHADGVGLMRTEFLYMERNQFPSEEEQYRQYRMVVERMSGRPTTFRLLDIGGDKPLPYFETPPERNPAMGWRGIRITLQWRDLIRVQLRALLRANAAGDLRVLIPMVTSIDEIREIHAIFDEVREELVAQGYDTGGDCPVGAMIEVPSALFELDRIAAEVDFVSVGTNDLVQYMLAIDRDNSWVSQLYDPHHPSVVRALHQIARTANAGGIPASVCGDAAGDPAFAVLLLGMGFDAVSVAPQFIPEIKYAVRRTTLSDADDLVSAVLARETATGVREALDSWIEQLYGQWSRAEGS